MSNQNKHTPSIFLPEVQAIVSNHKDKKAMREALWEYVKSKQLSQREHLELAGVMHGVLSAIRYY